MYCTHPSWMLVHTCKSHWKVGGYQTHLLFHSVWTAGAVHAWLPSPLLQSPCTYFYSTRSTCTGEYDMYADDSTHTVRMRVPSTYVQMYCMYIWQCATWRTIPASFLSGSLCQFINSCLHFWRTCLHMWLHESTLITDSTPLTHLQYTSTVGYSIVCTI